jgi:hypothetical protein
MPGAAATMILLPKHQMAIVQLANDAAAGAANNAILATILAKVVSSSRLDPL